MTIKNSIVSLAFGLSMLLSMAATALSQSTTGTIRGTVVDPSGALVPRAQITINNATGFSRTLKSGSTGSFEVPHLAPGSYSVSISALGFTPALDGGIQVVGDTVTQENIKLGISVDSEIDVSADAADAR